MVDGAHGSLFPFTHHLREHSGIGLELLYIHCIRAQEQYLRPVSFI
jgi:hypothetical protein